MSVSPKGDQPARNWIIHLGLCLLRRTKSEWKRVYKHSPTFQDSLVSLWLPPFLSSSFCLVTLTLPPYISSVYPSLIPLPSLSPSFYFHILPFCFGTESNATDIKMMMMPWIWCLNTIIPPPCSLLTSPPPSILCCEGGSLREILAYNRICSHLKFPRVRAIAFSSSQPSNLLFFSAF